MSTTRRGFLAGILAAGFAPAAIGSGILMPVRSIVTPRDAVFDLMEALWLECSSMPPPTITNQQILEAAQRAWVRTTIKYQPDGSRLTRIDTVFMPPEAALIAGNPYLDEGYKRRLLTRSY